MQLLWNGIKDASMCLSPFCLFLSFFQEVVLSLHRLSLHRSIEILFRPGHYRGKKYNMDE